METNAFKRAPINPTSNFQPPISVLFIIDDLGLGGAQRQLVEILKRMPREQFEVGVLSLSEEKNAYGQEILNAGIPLTLMPHRGKWSWKTLSEVRKGIRDFHPNIVYTWLFTAELYGRIAAFQEKVPNVITAMRNTVDDMPFHYRLVSRVLGKKTKLVTVNANAIRPGVIHAFGVPEKKIRTIYNGLDLEKFPRQSVNGKFHREWRLPAGAKWVAMIARFAPQKDHATFLRAAAQIVHEFPAAYFLLIGEGPLRHKLEEQAEALGLKDRAIFTGARRDSWEILQAIDVCVHATHFEGCSNVIMEAMAASKPVVATQAGGNAELIVSGETGYLTRIGDDKAIAAHVLSLLRDPKKAEAMGERARKRIEQHFLIERTVHETCQLFQEVMRVS